MLGLKLNQVSKGVTDGGDIGQWMENAINA